MSQSFGLSFRRPVISYSLSQGADLCVACFTQTSIKYIKDTAPKKYHDFLIPKYRKTISKSGEDQVEHEANAISFYPFSSLAAFGCKRVVCRIVSLSYLVELRGITN